MKNQKIQKKSCQKKWFFTYKSKLWRIYNFLTKLYHYVPINSENQTRWSLNFRYKNLFSPYSQKGYLDYFEPVNYSEVTNLVLSNEK